MEQYPLIDTGAVLAVAGPHKGLPAIVVDSPENSLRGIDSAGADHGLVRAGIIAVFVNTEYGYAALDDINADEIGEAGLCLYIELLVAFKRPELLHEALAFICKLNLLLTRGKGIAGYRGLGCRRCGRCSAGRGSRRCCRFGRDIFSGGRGLGRCEIRPRRDGRSHGFRRIYGNKPRSRKVGAGVVRIRIICNLDRNGSAIHGIHIKTGTERKQHKYT